MVAPPTQEWFLAISTWISSWRVLYWQTSTSISTGTGTGTGIGTSRGHPSFFFFLFFNLTPNVCSVAPIDHNQQKSHIDNKMPIDTLRRKTEKYYSANKIIHINSNRKKCVSPYFMRECWCLTFGGDGGLSPSQPSNIPNMNWQKYILSDLLYHFSVCSAWEFDCLLPPFRVCCFFFFGIFFLFFCC